MLSARETGAREAPLRGVLHGGRRAWIKRLDNALLIGIPLAGSLAVPFWFARHPFGLIEAATFAIGYLVIGLGIGTGFHRLFSHRSYRPHPVIRYGLAIAGSMAAQGSLRRWVMDHRRHHARTDAPGDVHSPYFDGRGRPTGRLRGFFHAHVGWMFDDAVTDPAIYARDLLHDPFHQLFHRTRWLWPAASLALPAAAGYAAGGYVHAVGCLLTGGCLKITLFQNVVWSVNSIGHSFGAHPYPQVGQSRNHRLLAWATLGDGWHNNHHFAPRSAIQGFGPGQSDPAAWLILWLRRRGLATHVILPPLSAAPVKASGAPASAGQIEIFDDSLPHDVAHLRARLGVRPVSDALDEVSRHYVLRDGSGGAVAALRVTHWNRAEATRLLPLPLAPPPELSAVAGTASYVVSRGRAGDLQRLIEAAWRHEYAAGGRLDLSAVRPEVAPLYLRLGYAQLGTRTVRHRRTGRECLIMALASGEIPAGRRLAMACPSWEESPERALARRFLRKLSELLE